MHHVSRFLDAARHLAVPGVTPRLTMREKMAAALSMRRGRRDRAKEHGEQVGHQRFIPVFLYSSSESTAFAAARRGPKAGDSPVQKAAQAVDNRADNPWKTTAASLWATWA